jgi:hypothetical protein
MINRSPPPIPGVTCAFETLRRTWGSPSGQSSNQWIYQLIKPESRQSAFGSHQTRCHSLNHTVSDFRLLNTHAFECFAIQLKQLRPPHRDRTRRERR